MLKKCFFFTLFVFILLPFFPKYIIASDYYHPDDIKDLYDRETPKGSILAPHAYEHLRVLYPGEYMPIRILYQSGTEEQKEAIEKEFTDADGKIAVQVSREQVEKYVFKQFNLYAIKAMSGKDGFKLPKEEQNVFISANREKLYKIQEAIDQGIFTPYARTEGDLYPRDLEIFYRVTNLH